MSVLVLSCEPIPTYGPSVLPHLTAGVHVLLSEPNANLIYRTLVPGPLRITISSSDLDPSVFVVACVPPLGTR